MSILTSRNRSTSQPFKYQPCTCEGPELGHYCVCRLPGTVDTDIYTFTFWIYRVSSWFQTISTSVKWHYLKWLPIFCQLVCFFICYMKHFAYVPQRLRWFYSDEGVAYFVVLFGNCELWRFWYLLLHWNHCTEFLLSMRGYLDFVEGLMKVIRLYLLSHFRIFLMNSIDN